MQKDNDVERQPTQTATPLAQARDDIRELVEFADKINDVGLLKRMKSIQRSLNEGNYERALYLLGKIKITTLVGQEQKDIRCTELPLSVYQDLQNVAQCSPEEILRFEKEINNLKHLRSFQGRARVLQHTLEVQFSDNLISAYTNLATHYALHKAKIPIRYTQQELGNDPKYLGSSEVHKVTHSHDPFKTEQGAKTDLPATSTFSDARRFLLRYDGVLPVDSKIYEANEAKFKEHHVTVMPYQLKKDAPKNSLNDLIASRIKDVTQSNLALTTYVAQYTHQGLIALFSLESIERMQFRGNQAVPTFRSAALGRIYEKNDSYVNIKTGKDPNSIKIETYLQCKALQINPSTVLIVDENGITQEIPLDADESGKISWNEIAGDLDLHAKLRPIAEFKSTLTVSTDDLKQLPVRENAPDPNACEELQTFKLSKQEAKKALSKVEVKMTQYEVKLHSDQVDYIRPEIKLNPAEAIKAEQSDLEVASDAEISTHGPG